MNLNSDMRSEDELILCCARTSLDSESTDRIKILLTSRIDWLYVNQNALRHGVMPLLYINLKRTFPEAVPKSIMEQLRKQFLANIRRNLFLTGELLKLLHLFEKDGIPAIPFKGPTLAALAYGDIALRQFSDLDIFIHERDIQRVRDLLISQGYKPEIQLTSSKETIFLRSQRDYKFFRNDGRVIVEIQWGITQRYFPLFLDSRCLWERLELISFDGRNVKTFSPEDMLLILCLHGFYHCWNQVKWICDIAELIHGNKEMHWIRMIQQARTQGSERILFLGLLLARNLLKTDLPEKVLQEVKADPKIELLAAQLCEWLCKGLDYAPGDIKYFLFHIKIWKRFQGKIRYCIGLATTTNAADWRKLPLPPLLFPLYYLLRPIRLLKKYGLNKLKSTPTV